MLASSYGKALHVAETQKRTKKVKIVHFSLKTNKIVNKKLLQYLCASHVLDALYKAVVVYV
jgi:hypothetical protein